MPGPSRRAAEVLERLAGERPDDLDLPPARRPAVRPSQRTLLIAAAVVLALVGATALLLLDRRMPPVEERLPLASEQPTSTSVSTSAVTTPAASDPAGLVVVHVAGAVAAPGVVELQAGSRVVDAVRAAGGLRPDADPDRVNLAAELADGQRVVIPVVGQEAPVEIQPSGGVSGSGGSDDPAALVDLNAATADQLESLPGVGPATAAAIIAHRERNGNFTSVDGLLDVRGIGEAKLEALRDLVTVGGGS